MRLDSTQNRSKFSCSSLKMAPNSLWVPKICCSIKVTISCRALSLKKISCNLSYTFTEHYWAVCWVGISYIPEMIRKNIHLKKTTANYLLRVVKKLTLFQLLILENSTKFTLLSQVYYGNMLKWSHFNLFCTKTFCRIFMQSFHVF